MGADLVIYGMKGSPFVRKVQVLLAEKGIEYELEGVNIFPAPDWFAAINPAKRIPVLRDRSVGADGVAGTIPDSSAICAYLERKHPEPPLYLKQAFAYGRALWLEEYADSELASLVGDAFSIADIAVATQFVNLRFAGGSVDAARWPNLAAYVERMQARTSFATRIEAESRLFPPGGYEL